MRFADMITIDQLAKEIRRVDGNHSLGAGALAEKLMPFIAAAIAAKLSAAEQRERELVKALKHADMIVAAAADQTETDHIGDEWVTPLASAAKLRLPIIRRVLGGNHAE
jgi:hypothetical protein